jgi:hypothetical protein
LRWTDVDPRRSTLAAGPAGHVIAGNLIDAPAWVAGASNQASALRLCGTLTGFHRRHSGHEPVRR